MESRWPSTATKPACSAVTIRRLRVATAIPVRPSDVRVEHREHLRQQQPGQRSCGRANLTLQDRLVKELRLRGISNMPDANAFAAHFMASYNARFAKPPRSEHNCHRPLHSDEDLDLIFAWREARRVSQRLTVQYDKVLYLLADTPQSVAWRVIMSRSTTTRMAASSPGWTAPPSLYHLRPTLRDRPGCHRREQALGSCAASRPARPSAARQSALAIGTGKSAAVNARQDAVEEGAARTDAGRYRRRPG